MSLNLKIYGVLEMFFLYSGRPDLSIVGVTGA